MIWCTSEQGNMLIQLLLAHVISDFILQTDEMVQSKKWLSKYMLLHVAIVYFTTALLTGWWLGAVVIACLHYIIDGFKIEVKRRAKTSDIMLFLVDQCLHFVTILFIWAYNLNLWEQLEHACTFPFKDYEFSLTLLGYIIVTTPVGYAIKWATQSIQKTTSDTKAEIVTNENGGKRIGIFERIIILTFVLLNKYEAIGFLITGKSIIRFADKDSHLRSEYVLVGTMMSYAFSILVGAGINWLLVFSKHY